jgi:hypothetical protein
VGLRRKDTTIDNYKYDDAGVIDDLDNVRAILDDSDYIGALHYHDEHDGPGLLVHDAPCANDDPIAVDRPTDEYGGYNYGPRLHTHPERGADG